MSSRVIVDDGGCGLAVKAPDCGSGDRGFESRHPPCLRIPVADARDLPMPGRQLRCIRGSKFVNDRRSIGRAGQFRGLCLPPAISTSTCWPSFSGIRLAERDLDAQDAGVGGPAGVLGAGLAAGRPRRRSPRPGPPAWPGYPSAVMVASAPRAMPAMSNSSTSASTRSRLRSTIVTSGEAG